MEQVWEGYYEDGRSPLRRPVHIRLSPQGVQCTLEQGECFCWPYRELRQTQGFAKDEPLHLERGIGVSEALVITDPAFLQTFLQFSPLSSSLLHRLRRWGASDQRPLRLAATVLLTIVVLLRWGIPTLVGMATPFVPLQWEEGIGQQVLTQLVAPDHLCTAPEGRQAIGDILGALTAAVATPYRFRVLIVDSPEVNALAAPGGYILVYRGLLEHTQNAEELAGVLAHEMQHVLQQHSTRRMLHDYAVGWVIAGLRGQTTDPLTGGGGAAQVLTTLQYSRWQEEEADRKGFELLVAAGIDPGGMITLYEDTLGAQERTTGEPPTYLSSHPHMAQRVAALKALATGTSPHFGRLVAGTSWSRVRGMCHTHSPSP